MRNQIRKNTLTFIGALAFLLAALPVVSNAADAIRPPAVPLIACDPYFSIWSCSDTLNGDVTRHWTGRPHPLTSLIRIDGKTYRLMGAEPKDIPALQQTALAVYPTRTVYTFEGAGVSVEMTFMQPALPDDIDLLSLPVVYLTWQCRSTDEQQHEASIYLDAGMELVVNDDSQEVIWSKEQIGDMTALKAGSREQNILGRKGDNVRIDWGYFYMAAQPRNLQSAIAPAEECRSAFAGSGELTETVATNMPRRVRENAPVMAMRFGLRPIGAGSRRPSRCSVMLAYDDIESVLYFSKPLKAWWKREGKTIQEALTESAAQFRQRAQRCMEFDGELMADLEAAGGPDYVSIGSLAYRQALGANKIVADKNGMPLMFSKENFSNGCMGTVDVFYPFAPQVILLNPTLAKASFVPILEYGRSERWRFPFAPHDIGTYPHAMGQVYGGGERSEENQMPVEECGNMMLLVAGVVAAEGDVAFARQYWDVLTRWAEYLKSKGLDPENQLCTDDFAGHLAHNVNLSVKAIVALGAYAKMADLMGEKETARSYRQTAESYVKRWMQMADNGDHYRLAFDREDTWSQKYNLIWDLLLKLDLFPDSVAQKEMAYYKKIQKEFGLPLDNRSDYTKLDWIFWTASITNNKADFEALIAPVARFLNATPDRVPMTDWYWTHNAKHRGFQARPVVGGVFIRLMGDDAIWKKWVNKSDKVTGTWAPLPKPPKIVKIVATSEDEAQTWSYTTTRPGDGWFKVDFDASGWKEGPGGFGTRDTPSTVVRTRWDNSDIWIRRTFELKDVPGDLKLMIHHDEDADVYINGVLAAQLTGYTTSYMPIALTETGLKALKRGKNTIAIHCHQTGGGQYIDAGLVRVIEQE